jgi:N-acetylglucosaminyldiphosphoundecaprenol N-acetyl-beta-D-mannosaminyltransferase
MKLPKNQRKYRLAYKWENKKGNVRTRIIESMRKSDFSACAGVSEAGVTRFGSRESCAGSLKILGVPVSILDMPRAVTTIISWAKQDAPRTVFARDVAALMLAVNSPSYRQAHERADLVTPDGTPLVWIGRLRGYAMGRVCGPDLLSEICREGLQTGQGHYFYGGRQGVAQELGNQLKKRFPGLRVVGTYSPPMREIGPDFRLTDEIRAELDAIKSSGADFVWVGLSSPKQDYFIMKAARYVGRGVFLAVGAAFDFHSGRVKRAPRWMQKIGLEWMHRLISEPRRLWRRYLVLMPRFLWLLALERAAGWSK